MKKTYALTAVAVAALGFAPLAATAQTVPATPPASACSVVSPDAADFLRATPVVQSIIGIPDVSSATILQARAHLGCGPAPSRTPDQIKAQVCPLLTVDGVNQLLAETKANAQVRALVAANSAAEKVLLTTARDQAGCNAPSASVAPSAPSTAGNNDSQVTVIPQAAPETGEA